MYGNNHVGIKKMKLHVYYFFGPLTDDVKWFVCFVSLFECHKIFIGKIHDVRAGEHRS